jgi:hypothetical protein
LQLTINGSLFFSLLVITSAIETFGADMSESETSPSKVCSCGISEAVGIQFVLRYFYFQLYKRIRTAHASFL